MRVIARGFFNCIGVMPRSHLDIEFLGLVGNHTVFDRNEPGLGTNRLKASP